MGIGKRIKEARERLGLTQKELGDLLGVTGSAVTNYENETSHPKEPIMYKMFEALHVDANYLFQDEMKKSPASANAETGELGQDDRELLDDYHKLNGSGKEAARNAVHGLTYAPNYQKIKDESNAEISIIASSAVNDIHKIDETARINQSKSVFKK